MSIPDDVHAIPPTSTADSEAPPTRAPFGAGWIPANHPLADREVFRACVCGWLATLDAVRHDVDDTNVVQRVRSFSQAFEAAFSDNRSDASTGDLPDLEDVDDSSEDEDASREPYLQYILAMRDCSRRREAEGLPPVVCSRAAPCDDCSAHPGAAATSVRWQTMSDHRVAQELALYLRQRNLAPWLPPSPNTYTRLRNSSVHIPGTPTGSNASSPAPRRRIPGGNQASPASSISSEPPSPVNALPSTPISDDLSDLSD